MLPPSFRPWRSSLSASLLSWHCFFSGKGGGGSDLKCLAADGGKHETDPTQPKKKSSFFSAPILISLISGERASGPPSFITSVRPKNKPTDGYETTYRERGGRRGQEDRKGRDGDGDGMGKLSPPTLRMELIQRAFESPTLAHPQRSHRFSQFRN